jgi:hypothetical protein
MPIFIGEALDRSRDVVTGENKSAKNTRLQGGVASAGTLTPGRL